MPCQSGSQLAGQTCQSPLSANANPALPACLIYWPASGQLLHIGQCYLARFTFPPKFWSNQSNCQVVTLVYTDHQRLIKLYSNSNHLLPFHGKHKTLTQCCCIVGPESQTMAQQYNNIGLMFRVCWELRLHRCEFILFRS